MFKKNNQFKNLFFLFVSLFIFIFFISNVSSAGPYLYEHQQLSSSTFSGPDLMAQTFTIGSNGPNVNQIPQLVSFLIAGTGQTFNVSIRKTNSTGGPLQGHVNDLCFVQQTVSVTGLTWVNFTLSGCPVLNQSTQYAAVIYHASTINDYESGDAYAGGVIWREAGAGLNLIPYTNPSFDLPFQIWGINGSVLKFYMMNISQTVNINNNLSVKRVIKRNITSSFAISNNLSKKQSLTRNISISVKISNVATKVAKMYKNFTQSLTFSNSATKSKIKMQSQSDSFNISNNLSKQLNFNKGLSQSLTISNSISRVGTFFKNFFQSLGFSNSATKSKIKMQSQSDSFNIITNSVRSGNFFKSFSDYLILSNSLSKNKLNIKSLSVSILLNGNVNRFSLFTRAISDTINFIIGIIRKIFMQTTPSIYINSLPTIAAGSNFVIFNSTVTGFNLDSCWLNVYNATGQIDNGLRNSSFTCGIGILNNFTVSSFGAYNLIIYANNSGGNWNSTSILFATNANTPGGSTGQTGTGGSGYNTTKISILGISGIILYVIFGLLLILLLLIIYMLVLFARRKNNEHITNYS